MADFYENNGTNSSDDWNLISPTYVLAKPNNSNVYPDGNGGYTDINGRMVDSTGQPLSYDSKGQLIDSNGNVVGQAPGADTGNPNNRTIDPGFGGINTTTDSGGIGGLLKNLFTNSKTGNLDLQTLGTLGGGLAGALGALTPNNQKVGYQGGIPKYTATRNMVTAPPAGSRPGAGGVSYGGNVAFTPRAGATPNSPGSFNAPGSSGSSALSTLGKVAGGAGLAALLSKSLGGAGNANLASIIKSLGSIGAQPYKPTNPTLSPTEDETGPYQPTNPTLSPAEDERLPYQPSMPTLSPTEDETPTYDWYDTGYDYAKGGVAGVDNPRYLQGETDGMADKIPAQIGDDQPAALSHGEFVVPADVVSHLGNGNSDAGAKKLYQMMDKIRMARTGTKKQGKEINPDKFMPGGLAKAYANGGSVKHFVTGGDTSTTGLGSAVSAGLTGTEQAPASWAGEYITDMLGKGQALSEMPYQEYQGPLTAGASPLQQQAFGTASNLAVPGSVGAAAQTAGDIAAKAQNINYTPATFGNQFQAPAQSAATNFTNQYQAPTPYQNTNFTAGTFGNEQAQQYMNPYLQQSLNPQLAEARRQADITAAQNNAAMTKAGAFGGGRQAILTAENQRNLGTNLANITGQGYNTAYTNAMSQYNQDQARNLQAQQASEQSKQFGAQQGMTAAQLMAQYGMSAQQAQEAARQFQQNQAMTGAQSAAQYGLAGQQAGEASRQFGANLGLQGLNTGLQAAQTQGNLGISSGQLGLQNLAQQLAAGQQQRGIESEGIAADKAAFEAARDNPYKMVQFQQSLLNGLPITATNYNTLQPTKLQEILAGAGGGAKLAGTTDSGLTLDQALSKLGLGNP